MTCPELTADLLDLRALTIRQPWATAVVDGGKNIENRTRGPGRLLGVTVLIHAGAGWSDRGAHDPRIAADRLAALRPLAADPGVRALLGLPEQAPPGVAAAQELAAAGVPAAWYPRGALIGSAVIADAHPDGGCCRPWGESAYTEAGGRVRRDVWHWRLEDRRMLPEPVPCRGALGLWRVPADIADHVRFLLLLADPTPDRS